MVDDEIEFESEIDSDIEEWRQEIIKNNEFPIDNRYFVKSVKPGSKQFQQLVAQMEIVRDLYVGYVLTSPSVLTNPELFKEVAIIEVKVTELFHRLMKYERNHKRNKVVKVKDKKSKPKNKKKKSSKPKYKTIPGTNVIQFPKKFIKREDKVNEKS